MARFAFALGVEGEVTEAGVVQCESFDDALEELSRRYRPQKGDTLEIGPTRWIVLHAEANLPLEVEGETRTGSRLRARGKRRQRFAAV